MKHVAEKRPPTTFEMLDEALRAMRNTEDYAQRRLQHIAILRLIETTLRAAADRVSCIRRAA